MNKKTRGLATLLFLASWPFPRGRCRAPFFALLRRHDDINAWLRTGDMVPNQRSFAGLCLGLQLLSPGSSAAACETALLAMDYVRRHGCAEHFKTEVLAMRPWMDAALCRSLEEYKSHGQTKLTWWERYKELAALVLPVDAAAECMANEGSEWGPYSLQLGLLVSSSQVGRSLFGLALEQASCDEVKAQIATVIAELRSKQTITMELVDDALAKWREHLKGRGISTLSLGARGSATKIKFGGLQLEIGVASLMDELELHIWGLCKDVGLYSRTLESLWGDVELARYDLDGLRGLSVDAAILAKLSVVRGVAARYTEHGEASPNVVRQALCTHASFLQKTDASFRLERSFFQQLLNSSVADERFKCDVLGCLPSRGFQPKVEEALDKLVECNASILAKWVGGSVKVAASAIEDAVRSLQEGVGPKLGSSEDAFVKGALAALSRWCSFEVGGERPAPGLACARALYSLVDAQQPCKGGAGLVAADVRRLAQWAWLLPEASRKAALKWVDALAAPGLAAAAPPASSAGPKPKGGSSSSRNVGGSKAAVASLFAKK